MTKNTYEFDWSKVAFGSKKPITALRATFIAAPRELSPARFTEIIKTYLPKGNIVLGIAKETHVLGFADQPQFRMLKTATVQPIIDKVNASGSKHKVYTLRYFQGELLYLFEKLVFKKVVLVNGSWQYAFHTQAPYYALVNRHTHYDMISPFVDEAEARAFERKTTKEIQTHASPVDPKKNYSETDLLTLAQQVSKYSFDYTFQTGAVLGKQAKNGYTFLTSAFNAVVPYQTYAMHHGAARERHFSPPHDLNHYDTNHAEVAIILRAATEGVDLADTTLFINLMPCPTCARMLSQTPIREIVYGYDHSNGYAIDLLSTTGKLIRGKRV